MTLLSFLYFHTHSISENNSIRRPWRSGSLYFEDIIPARVYLVAWLHICSFRYWQFLYFKSFCDKSPPVIFLPLELLCLQSRWCILFGGDGMRFHHSFWWIWEFLICISFCTSFRVLCIFFSRFLLSGQHISFGSLYMGLSILCFSCVVFRCFFLFSIVCLLMFESSWR